jgi:integrase
MGLVVVRTQSSTGTRQGATRRREARITTEYPITKAVGALLGCGDLTTSPQYPVSGKVRDRSNTTGDLRRVFDRAGFDWVTSHTLRKTVATRLDDAGLSARQIADHLGHARPSLTQDVYLGRKVVSSQAARVLNL